MKIVAIESSSDACSVALGNGRHLLTRSSDEPRRHNELLPGMLDSVFQEAGMSPAELDAIAWGAGPGSFTGVRLAAAVALGVSLGTDVGCLSVDSMRALARQVARRLAAPATVGVLVDARMQQCYLGVYSVSADLRVTALAQPQMIAAGEIPVLPAGALRTGDGWQLCEQAVDLASHPMASDVLALAVEDLGDGVALAPRPDPQYLIGETRWTRQSGTSPTGG